MSDEEKKKLFCIGFSYGVRYGYEDILHGEMAVKEIAAEGIIAMMLYDEIKESL